MTSTQETNKPSTLFHPPTSPTQLLLPKPYSSPADEPTPHNHLTTFEPDPTQFFQVSYNHGPRPRKDRHFLTLFSLFLLSTFLFGIFAVVHRNPNSDVSSFIYDSTSTSCIRNSSSFSFTFDSPNPPILINSTLTSYHSSSSNLLKNLSRTLMITLILSVPILLSVLVLLKHYAKQVVYTSLPLFVIVPLFAILYWFTACTISPTCSSSHPNRIVVLAVVFFIIGLIVWLFVLNRHRIELTVRIIEIASNALSKNLGLFLVLPALAFALLLYFIPIVIFLVFANLNGEIGVREENKEFDCVWKQDGWVPAYYALASCTMLWSFSVMLEAQVYVISGTISQWYFSKDGSITLRKSITSSLRNAFGPSSGTICLSGLLYVVVRIVRAAVGYARKENLKGTINLILQSLVNALVTAFDFLNKFTITFAAITGEAYCTSAKMTYQLLKRNLLSAVFVETLSTRILSGIVFVLSAIYAALVWGILKVGSNLGVGESYFVAAAAWVVLIMVLGFFVHVLENVIHTVYICYAMDRDKGEVFKQEVHEVYVHLHITRDCGYPLVATARIAV